MVQRMRSAADRSAVKPCQYAKLQEGQRQKVPAPSLPLEQLGIMAGDRTLEQLLAEIYVYKRCSRCLRQRRRNGKRGGITPYAM